MSSGAQPQPPRRRVSRPLEHATRRDIQQHIPAGRVPPMEIAELERAETYAEYAEALDRLGLDPDSESTQ